MKITLKQKLLDMVVHPKLVTFGISLAIGMAIAVEIGMFDSQQHLAWGLRQQTEPG
jgi:hypothetical protein